VVVPVRGGPQGYRKVLGASSNEAYLTSLSESQARPTFFECDTERERH
jgi:hypothetical protein